MAAFPAITPSIRRYGFGLFPITTERGFGGGSVRFRHGSTRYGIQLELSYEFLSEAEAQALRDHYWGQDGGTRSFMLPNAIWAGHGSPANIVPLGTTWVYAAQTEEEHLSGLLFNGSVQLLQVI
jgi:hypothetical protein